MRGMQIKNGALFVEWGSLTYRCSEREGWGVSPISFSTLQWDMRSESPERYEYLTVGEILSLDSYGELKRLHEKNCKLLGLAFVEEEVGDSGVGACDAALPNFVWDED